jgi:hypothetical protein
MKSSGEAASQCAVLVLGAGRSGTSIITRAIQAVGVELGDDFKPPSRKNPTGFFEDAALLRLSKKLRRTLGLRPDSLRLLEESVWTSPEVTPFYGTFSATINDRFADTPIWGFKYGRTMRLLPFWARLFEDMDIEPRYVMAIRNPLSVARSRAKLDGHRGQQENSDLEWLVNVVPYFELVRHKKLVVVDYDRLMDDPVMQLERLAARLDLPPTDQSRLEIRSFANEFLKPGLQHTHFSIDDLRRAKNINVLVRDAYCWLDRLASDEISPAATELWDDWATIQADVLALGPILERLDVLARQRRHAQWNPLSPIPAAWKTLRRLMRR